MQSVGTYVATMMVVGMLLGCTQEAPPPAPVPPAPEDLSTWSVPELVQPVAAPVEPLPAVVKDKPTPAEQVLEYVAGTTYALTVSMHVPLDLVLGRGEQVRNIIGGDRTPMEPGQAAVATEQAPGAEGKATARWHIVKGAHGHGETEQQHIFVSAAVPGLRTGFIVTTTQRTYHFDAKSVQTSPVRTVRWKYLGDQAPVAAKREPGLLPDAETPRQWHVGYTLTSTQKQAPDWFPRGVYDEGRKLYIVLPEITLFETAPMVRMIGPNGPALVNVRQYLNVLILDQLAPRIELRVGIGEQAEVVTILRGQLRTIACPGDPACPVWPQAAHVLAQRQPPVPTPPAQPPAGPLRSGPRGGALPGSAPAVPLAAQQAVQERGPVQPGEPSLP